MTTATPTRPSPKLMPARRPVRTAVQTTTPASPERTFKRNPGDLTSTIGAALSLRENCTVDPELLYRPACNQACDRVQAYAEEVPAGKTKRRWQQTTAEKANAQIEQWFGLASEEDYKPNLLPNVLGVAQKIFVEVCVEHSIVGVVGQDTSWYREREPQVKVEAAAKAAKKHQPQSSATVSDGVKRQGRPASNLKDRRRACEDAKVHLKRFGRAPAKGKDETSPRWSEDKLTIGAMLLTAYFFTASTEEIGKTEAKLDGNAINVVRSKFAYACVKGEVRGTPGQQAAWYPEVEASTREFIQSRRPARPSH